MDFDTKSVFDLHPSVSEIYVVGDMPFIKKDHAEAYALSTGLALIVHEREATKEVTKEATVKTKRADTKN